MCTLSIRVRNWCVRWAYASGTDAYPQYMQCINTCMLSISVKIPNLKRAFKTCNRKSHTWALLKKSTLPYLGSFFFRKTKFYSRLTSCKRLNGQKRISRHCPFRWQFFWPSSHKSLTSHLPPPLRCFHQRFLRMCRRPASCSCRMALEMGTRNGEPGTGENRNMEQRSQHMEHRSQHMEQRS